MEKSTGNKNSLHEKLAHRHALGWLPGSAGRTYHRDEQSIHPELMQVSLILLG
jgi:hypothetical protein